MKKFLTGSVLGLILIGGSVTYAFADSDDTINHRTFMEETYPEWTEEEIESRLESCHGNVSDSNRPRGMMNGAFTD